MSICLQIIKNIKNYMKQDRKRLEINEMLKIE